LQHPLWLSFSVGSRIIIIIWHLLEHGHQKWCEFRLAFLASCLTNARPLPALRPDADDNSLIGCISRDLTDDWSLASTHIVGSQYQFWCSLFWVRSFVEPDLLDHNVLFDNTTPIYLINLP